MANCVEDHGEDGEDEGEQSPTGAEGGNDHCRRMGDVMKHGSRATLLPSLLMRVGGPRRVVLGALSALRWEHCT